MLLIPQGFMSVWRRDRDSNPGKAINLCRFSRPVHSTALPSLRLTAHILPAFPWKSTSLVQPKPDAGDFSALHITDHPMNAMPVHIVTNHGVTTYT